MSFLLISSLVLTACQGKIEELPPENNNDYFISQEQWEANDYELSSLTIKDFGKRITASGIIDLPPMNKAKVHGLLGGYVKNFSRILGEDVRKGELLFQLENLEFVQMQQDFLELHQQLNYLEKEFNRHAEMFAEKVTAEKNYLKAESDYKTALSKYQGLRQQLKMLSVDEKSLIEGNIVPFMNIYAPISGSIAHIHIINGSYIDPQSEVMELIDKKHVHVELKVYEKDVMYLKQGQKIEFSVPEMNDNTFYASIHQVGKTINEDRTVTVHGDIDQKDRDQFIAGMFVSGEIILDSRQALAIANGSIVDLEGAFFGLKLIDKTAEGFSFEKVEWKRGEVKDHYTEILNVADPKLQYLGIGAFAMLNQ